MSDAEMLVALVDAGLLPGYTYDPWGDGCVTVRDDDGFTVWGQSLAGGNHQSWVTRGQQQVLWDLLATCSERGWTMNQRPDRSWAESGFMRVKGAHTGLASIADAMLQAHAAEAAHA